MSFSICFENRRKEKKYLHIIAILSGNQRKWKNGRHAKKEAIIMVKTAILFVYS